MNKDTEEKIRQLQLFEQNMHTIIHQKQTFQAQTLEMDNALKELAKADGKVYKIIGTVMIDSTKDKLEKDLNERWCMIITKKGEKITDFKCFHFQCWKKFFNDSVKLAISGQTFK